jgi:hypothetical protein
VRFANAAFKAIDEVKRAQSLDSRSEGIRGGVPGSAPIGGAYIPSAFPNWAAKFFIDALCAKRAWLPPSPPRDFGVTGQPDTITSNVKVAIVPGARNVVVYTTRISSKFERLAATWRARGFTPSLVVIETGSASAARQMAGSLRRRADESVRICRRLRWRNVIVSTVNAPEARNRASGSSYHRSFPSWEAPRSLGWAAQADPESAGLQGDERC